MRTEASDEHHRQVGKRLMDARLAAGHPNRLEACRRFGFNPNTLKAHEYGHRGLNLAEAERYAEAFGTTATKILSPLSSGPDKPRKSAPSAPRPHHVVRTNPPAHQASAPPGTVDHVPSQDGGALGAHQAAAERTKRTTSDERPSPMGSATPTIIPVVGIAAYGVWVAPGSPLLHSDTPVSPIPGQPATRQYVRQAVAGSRSGQFAAGDYIVFLKIEPDCRPPAGLCDIRRSKGILSENAIWTATGRTLTCDSMATDAAEKFDYDPDDTSIRIEGVALGVYKPIKTTA